MAIALVAGSVVSNRATTAANAITVPSAAAGDLIPISLSGSSATVTLSSIVDSTGDTVSPAVAYVAATGGGVGIYFVKVVTAGSHTITATFSAAQNSDVSAARYTGAAGTLDGTMPAANGGSGTAITTNSVTPGQVGDLLITAITQSGSAHTYTWNNSFTQEALNTAGPCSGWGDLIDSAVTAINGSVTSNATASWNAAIAAFSPPAGAPPTVTSVNGGSAIAEGATGVAVVGTNFALGMTSAIAQPGVSVAQTTTFGSATAATFNLSMEPAGSQLAFTDATYTTTYTVTAGGQTSTTVSVTLTPPAGLIFQTLASVNPTSSQRITATPDLIAGDQLEAAGDALGTTAVPTGLTLNNDATYQFAAGDTPANFWVRAYDGTAKVWGAWAEQTVTGSGSQNGAVFHRRHSRVILAAA